MFILKIEIKYNSSYKIKNINLKYLPYLKSGKER